jgi:hypothetical protein
MTDKITISKTLSIRDCGFDEYWLQDQIVANPSILGLGDLEVVHREKQQSSGGKLDFLLEDSTDGSMYEVEVMLGATDESHIIRTIEYWELERHRWPKRSHTAVLVAEKINRRFFNVIQLLSLTIPVVAVQANIVEADEKRMLHFTTILDVYQEPEFDGRPQPEVVNENHWKNSASLASAKALQAILAPTLADLKIGFAKNYIRLRYSGEIYFSLSQRRDDKSAFYTWLDNQDVPAITSLLDAKSISYNAKPYGSTKWQTIQMEVDESFIKGNAELFQKIGKLVDQSWQRYFATLEK